MKKCMLFLTLIILFSFVSNNTTVIAESKDVNDAGEALFKKHCSMCHPHAAKLKSINDIVGKIRNPSPYMPRVSEHKISDSDAKRIADYILKAPH